MRNVLKILLGIILVVILTAFGFQGYQQYLAPQTPIPTTPPATTEEDLGPLLISAEGKLVPLNYSRLSFKVPGLVASVEVSEGDTIQAGELIASLEGREQIEASLAAARLELISSEQALDELRDLAPLVTAQAQQELAYAQDALEDVQRRWRSSQEGNRASGETIQAKELQLAQADELLSRAENEYAKYSGRPETDPVRLVAYSAYLSAKRVHDQILAQLNWYQGSPSLTTQAILDAELALAEERLAEAERRWELVKDGPDPNQIALLEARVESAKAQLTAVESSLEDLELRASFTGTIVSLDLKAGESVNPTVPVAVLADISQWQVETIDLTESDFALIHPEMEAVITLSAYPGREFHGRVREIGLLGEERRGSVTYTVTLDFDPEEAVVRWGMTAFVDIPLD